MKTIHAMKRFLALVALCAAFAPAGSSFAQVGVTITAPGVSVYIGDRDPRGYYWDGHQWRDPTWWGRYGRDHLVRYGEKDPRGQYWDGDQWRDAGWWKQHGNPHGCPPGQAKKGRC